MPELPPVVILTSIFESNIFPLYELGLTNGDGGMTVLLVNVINQNYYIILVY
jgi:hypothetical protein